MVKEERWRLYHDGNQSYRGQVKRERAATARRGEQTRCRTPAKTAGACAARAVSRLAGNGFELLLGTCSVPVKLAFCLQFPPLQFLLPSLSFGL
jgi:hypothetical protein